MLRSIKNINLLQTPLRVLVVFFLLSFSKSWGQTTDLIFSEYIEGSSSNKYIEIYNGTGSTINLAGYKLRLYANGAASPTNDITLSGSLATCSVVIYKNTSATLSLPGGVASTVNAAVNYNGDDAVVLFKVASNSIVDIIGQIGCDPGSAWTSGVITTLDKTLVRKAGVCNGITTNPGAACGVGSFLTLSSEWDVYSVDDASHLGNHTNSCGGCGTPISHIVTFNSNGGSGSMAPQTANITTNLTNNAFTKSGCTFTGWNTIANGSGTSYADGASYSFASDLTLYAQWNCAAASHTVTFDANGGLGSMSNQTANTTTNLTNNAFTNSGCTFNGWNTAANGLGTSYSEGSLYNFATDITLYAQWNCGFSHTVNFDANGGLGSMSNQTANTTTNLTNNAFTNSGCTFNGWNTFADGSGTPYADGASYNFASDITLYAQWNCSPVCPYLISAVINSCDGCASEGNNEFLLLNTGSYSFMVNSSNVNITFSNGPTNITSSFAAQPTSLATLNTATINACGTTFVDVSNGGITVPPNSTFLIINKGACFIGNWSAYCGLGNVYVAFSAATAWSVGGFFGNNNTARAFVTNFSGINSACGTTTYAYNQTGIAGTPNSFNSDGASVLFTGGFPTYINGNGDCAPPSTILPIELIDFYATKKDKQNEIVWKVAEEKDIEYYGIEKSMNGIDFSLLGNITLIQRKTGDGIIKSYSIVDESPFDDITYYRLGTKGKNGKIEYQKIISIDESSKDWDVYHYQQEQNLVIEFKNSVPKNSTISLIDFSGKLLVEDAVKDSQTNINTQSFSEGIYFVRITTPYKTENFKIIIQK